MKKLKKGYEILYYKSTPKNCIVTPSHPYLGHGSWHIHSVKRLSDNTIFTINDELDSGIKKFTISNIIIDLNTIYFHVHNYSFRIDIKNAVKYKNLLFTTDDGVNIFKNDTVHFICNEFSYNVVKIFDPLIDNNLYKCALNKTYKTFSTQEAAEKYLLIYKPCLSLNDVTFNLDKAYVTNEMMESLKNLVKSKL